MLLLMQTTGARQMKIQTVGFIRLELSLEMFMKVTLHFAYYHNIFPANNKTIF